MPAAQNKISAMSSMQSRSELERELFSHNSVPEVCGERNVMRKRDVCGLNDMNEGLLIYRHVFVSSSIRVMKQGIPKDVMMYSTSRLTKFRASIK
jgi:hypothetical protein